MTSTALWVANAAVLVTNAALLTALDPGTGVLVLMAVVTGLLALGSALLARARRRAGGSGSPLPVTGVRR